MRRISIRHKLAAALAVPMVALVIGTVAEAAARSAHVAEVREQADLAQATVAPSALLAALQVERAWPAAELVGLGDQLAVPVDGYQDAWDATDAAIEAFRSDLESRPAAARRAYAEPLAGLDELVRLRADILASTEPPGPDNLAFSDQVFTRYTELIAPFLDATNRLVPALDDAGLRQGAELIDLTDRQVDDLARLLNALATGVTRPDGLSDRSGMVVVMDLSAEAQENEARLQAATGPYEAVVADHLPAGLVERALAAADSAVEAGQMTDVQPIADAFATPEGEGYPALRQALGAEVERQADELTGRAESARRGFLGVAGLVVIGTVALVVVVSRSITRPLRSLTEQAATAAEDRLPAAVDAVLDTPPGEDVVVPAGATVAVRSRDEVADVADALNTVLDTALQLAVEQARLRRNVAGSFVSLGRRNQSLLSRQIDFITELESREEDGEALRDLFRLDHLATRMRRNAESLLVLAGVEPPRQWAAPVPLLAVVRSAVGEVEDYQRVIVRDLPPAAVPGSAAIDLAHLLAELIENALAASAGWTAGQAVEVRQEYWPDGRYALLVVDSGPGMSAAALRAANRRLAGKGQFTVAPSRFLGHYVVAQLAARHDIDVRLRPTVGTGVTAAVAVPLGMFEPARPVTGETAAVGRAGDAYP